MPTVLLVRHAQASFGSADYDLLSPVGLEQAALLAAALAARDLEVGRVATGPARRHRDTAAACLEVTGVEAEVDERWDEYATEEVLTHHAAAAVSLEGTGTAGEAVTSRQFQAVLDDALAEWTESGERTPAAQSWPFFLESRVGALNNLAAGLGSGETGIAFTSGGAIAAICARLLGGDGGEAALFPRLNRVLVNTGITKIAIGRSGASLVSFNEHAHIDEGGGALLTYR